MLRARSLTGQSFLLAGSTAIAQILNVALITLVVRRTSPSGFGEVAVALGLGGFLAGLLDFGFTPFSVREIAASRMPLHVYWQNLNSKVFLSFSAGCIAVIAGALFSHLEFCVAVILVAVGRSMVMGVNVPSISAQEFSKVAIVLIVERAAALLCFVSLLMASPVEPVANFWISLCVGSVSAGAIGLIFGRSNFRVTRRPLKANPWRGVGGYGTFALALSAATTDVALLGAGGGAYQAGLYGAVSRWTQPVLLLSQAYSSAIAPAIGRAATARLALATIRPHFWIPAVGIVGCATTAVVAPFAIDFLVGQEYKGSAPVLAVLSLGACLVLANQPLATFLQSRKLDKFVGQSVAVVVVLHLCSVTLIAGCFGALGAAVCYVLTQGVLTLVLAFRVAGISCNGETSNPVSIAAAHSDPGVVVADQ